MPSLRTRGGRRSPRELFALTPKRQRQKRDADQTLWRSRGGLSTRIHVRANAKGRPHAFALTGGEGHGLRRGSTHTPHAPLLGIDPQVVRSPADTPHSQNRQTCSSSCRANAMLASMISDAPLAAASRATYSPCPSTRAITNSNMHRRTEGARARKRSWNPPVGVVSLESSENSNASRQVLVSVIRSRSHATPPSARLGRRCANGSNPWAMHHCAACLC